MKTKKIFLGLSIFIVATHASTVLAASKSYFSISTNYGSGENGGTGVPEATMVAGRLNLEGYSGLLNTKPTYSNLNSTYQGKKAMESSILYFLGHASSDSIKWNYNYNGGNYATGVGKKATDYYSGIYHLRGIGAYNLNNVRLAVFQGCSTASDSNSNLPKYAVSRGAAAAIGWATNIEQRDTYPWTERFFTKQFANSTIASQVAYANSFAYTTSAIKNTRLYGNTGASLLTSNFNIQKVNSLSGVDERRHMVNEPIKLDYSRLDTVKGHLIALINRRLNVNILNSDFIIEKVQNDSNIIYDLYFTVNGARTKLAYTIFANISNDYVTDIYDNTGGYKLESIKNAADKSLLVKKVSEEYNAKNIATIGNVIGSFDYYDVDSGKYYRVVQSRVLADSKSDEYSIVDNFIEL